MILGNNLQNKNVNFAGGPANIRFNTLSTEALRIVRENLPKLDELAEKLPRSARMEISGGLDGYNQPAYLNIKVTEKSLDPKDIRANRKGFLKLTQEGIEDVIRKARKALTGRPSKDPISVQRGVLLYDLDENLVNQAKSAVKSFKNEKRVWG